MSFVVPGPLKDTLTTLQKMDYQLPLPSVVPQTATVLPSVVPSLTGHQVPVGVMQGTLTTHVQGPPTQQQQQQGQQPQDETHRWTQYQQLWRQHVYMNGTINITLFLYNNNLEPLAGETAN